MFDKIKNSIVKWITTVTWKSYKRLTLSELEYIRQSLIKDYYIILTVRSGTLTTLAIQLSHLFLTGRWGYYVHALMNLEDEVKSDKDFRLIEADGDVVQYSSFATVFTGCKSVALMKPRSMSVERWTQVLDRAKRDLGKPYDTLFNIADDTALSCVELIRDALKAEPNYETNFANFERMISESKNLDPMMFYECEDFEIAWETRH
jgi:hypothetical protein